MIDCQDSGPYCPWCGCEMEKKITKVGGQCSVYYRCFVCGAPSPASYGLESELAELETGAYNEANGIVFSPGNRLLTIDEVRTRNIVWTEKSADPFCKPCYIRVIWYAQEDMFDYFFVLDAPVKRERPQDPVTLKVFHMVGDRRRHFWLKKPTSQDVAKALGKSKGRNDND